MEFSAGLMPLETALTQMLSRITPLTAVETLPLVNCFGRILATDIVSPSMSPALIIQLWMVMRYAWRICPPISRCPSPAKHLPVSPTRRVACGNLHSHYDRRPGTGRLRGGSHARADGTNR